MKMSKLIYAPNKSNSVKRFIALIESLSGRIQSFEWNTLRFSSYASSQTSNSMTPLSFKTTTNIVVNPSCGTSSKL